MSTLISQPILEPCGLVSCKRCDLWRDFLRLTAPFQRVDQEKLLDLRAVSECPYDDAMVDNWAKPYDCPTYPQLIQALAACLCTYDVSCSIGCQDAFNRYTETINSRIHLRNEIGLFLDLQADGKLPASSPVKSRHRKILLKAHQEWLGIIQSLMPEDYYLQQTRRAEISYRQWLLQRMYEAFRTYGPKGFRKEAIFCTIAIILFDLVIEHPKPHKGIADLAEALRKRIERARP